MNCTKSTQTPANEEISLPDFINFDNLISKQAILYATAGFVRNSSNTNPTISIATGPDISPGTIWFSPHIYLPSNVFNISKPATNVVFDDGRNVSILDDITLIHDVLIQFKITKNDNTAYANNRELRCTFVREDGTTPYDTSLLANEQPASGMHDFIILRGSIQHTLGDIVKLKFNLVQDNYLSDVSDTKITIFRITWNVLGLEEIPP